MSPVVVQQCSCGCEEAQPLGVLGDNWIQLNVAFTSGRPSALHVPALRLLTRIFHSAPSVSPSGFPGVFLYLSLA